MTRTRTPAQTGAWSRNKGAQAERDATRYLRSRGFDNAERAVRTGFRVSDRTVDDPGDLAGIPGTIVSVKDAQTHYVDAWLRELDAMDANDTLALRLLLIKRKYKADPGQWRCLMRYPTFTALTCVPDWSSPKQFPVEVAFADVVTLLADAIPARYRQHEETS